MKLIQYDPMDIIKKSKLHKDIKEFLLGIEDSHWKHICKRYENETIDKLNWFTSYDIVDDEAKDIAKALTKDSSYFADFLKCASQTIMSSMTAFERLRNNIERKEKNNEKIGMEEGFAGILSDTLYKAVSETKLDAIAHKNGMYKYVNDNVERYQHIENSIIENWIKNNNQTEEDFLKEHINDTREFFISFSAAEFPIEKSFNARSPKEAMKMAIDAVNGKLKETKIKLAMQTEVTVTNRENEKLMEKMIVIDNLKV